jgi:hypothetical protein
MANFNPWSTRKVAASNTPATPIADTPDYPVMVQSAYAVPSLESGSPFNDEFGWSNKGLQPSAVEYPSAQRLMTIPRRDFYPDPVRPPDEFYEENRGREVNARHSSQEFVDADGWEELKGVTGSDRRWADDPRRTPPPETRLTQQMAPRTYLFERPYGQDSERYLNGNHFSMADHRRSYEIQQFGMNPVTTPRNTYRLEPAPWDVNVVDVPPDSQPVYARHTGQNLPPGPRTWRLM